MTEIAFAPPRHRAEIARFMQQAFPRAKWGPDGWQRLLDGRWAGTPGRYAITARDNGALVGVLGLVCATRQTPDGPRETANMSSWYVAKSHRGQGLGSRMLELLTAQPGLTVTDVSSSKAAVPVVERAGFTVLDADRLIWHARPARSHLPLDRAPLNAPDLPETDRRVIADHAGLPLEPLRIATPDGPCTLVLSVKRKHDAYVTHEVLYLGQPGIFAAHARAIADSLLPDSAAILSVDRRLLPPDTPCEATETFAVPRLYTPGRMNPAHLDHMYSEIVLLGLKLC